MTEHDSHGPKGNATFSLRDQLGNPEADTPRHERLDPRTLTYDELKVHLIQLHNNLAPEAQADDFADRNYLEETMGPTENNIADRDLRYPAKADKPAVLEFALQEAQLCDDPEDQAVILATGVVNDHLFTDGSGRLSREVYRKVRSAPTPQEPARGDASANIPARAAIDFGTAFSEDRVLDGYAERFAYAQAGLKPRALRIGVRRDEVDDDAAATRVTPEELAGLSEAEQRDLVDALGIDEIGNSYDMDFRGLRFAAAALLARRPDLETTVHPVPDSDAVYVDMHEALAACGPDDRKEFVASLWQHRKLRAMGTVAAVSPRWGGQQRLRRDTETTVRDRAIARTNNMHPGRTG